MAGATETGWTIGNRARKTSQELAGRQLVHPTRPLVMRESSPLPKAATQTDWSIGARARATQFPRAVEASPILLTTPPQDKRGGRHRPEYIISTGEQPVYMKTPAVEPTPAPPQPIRASAIVPVLLDSEALPQRVYGVAFTALSGETLPPPHDPSLLQQLPRRAAYQELTNRVTKRLNALRPTSLLTQLEGSPLDAVGMLGTISSSASHAKEPVPAQELRSAKKEGVHAKREPKTRRRLIAATAALSAGVALVSGGLHFFKEKKVTPTFQDNAAVLPLPSVPSPVEALPVPIVHLTETGTISAQDRTGWGHAANLTRDALDRTYALNGVTNIVAKVGAYDSQLVSPNPDDAGPGDTMETLTKRAIQQVDRLRQPLGPEASQTELDAARIINQLNNLSPMDTQTFITNYASQIQALKSDLITILSTQQGTQHVLLAPQRLESAHATPGKTVFSLTLTAAQAETLRKGKDAIAALARDRQNRQRQPAWV